MFEPIPVNNEKRQTIVGLAVFGFCFWLTYSIFGMPNWSVSVISSRAPATNAAPEQT